MGVGVYLLQRPQHESQKLLECLQPPKKSGGRVVLENTNYAVPCTFHASHDRPCLCDGCDAGAASFTWPRHTMVG